MSICFHNKKYTKLEECRLPVTDLIIQRGVGVFDSIRTYGRKTFALRQHLGRLVESARLCGIKAGEIIDILPEVIKRGIAHPDAPKGELLVKPFITGGKTNLRGAFPEPDFFVIFDEFSAADPDIARRGVELEPNFMERPFPRIKTTSYITGLIPLREGNEKALETLYCPGDEITEAMTSNFFLCIGGALVTAPPDKALKGITRDIVLTLAKENGFKTEERCPLVSELPEAQEAFITASFKEVVPVVKIGGQTIGEGVPGPVAKHLQKLFSENIGRWLDK